MSCFFTLLELGSNNNPVALKISFYSKPPQNSRTTSAHGPLYSSDSRVFVLRFFKFMQQLNILIHWCLHSGEKKRR